MLLIEAVQVFVKMVLMSTAAIEIVVMEHRVLKFFIIIIY